MKTHALMLASLGISALTLVPAGMKAQPFVPGPQVLTFLSDVDDSDQPYGLYLPKNFDAKKKYPLVISLHGAWSNHRLNLRRVFGQSNRPGESDAEATRYFPPLRDVDYIVASPYARGTLGYQGIPEKDVYDVLADVKRRFPIDEDRIYLTGLSMGGGGTAWLALTHPDIWAAIAPVCPAIPAGSDDLAPNLLNVPVHFFHGDQDPAVPVDMSRKWHKRLLELNTNVEYIEYPGVKHNSWENAYKDGTIFDWFGKYKRNRYPDRVRFNTRWYKYNSAYWVRFDALTPGSLATVDARFTGPNKIEIATSDLDGFSLSLDGHPKYAKSRALEVSVDGTRFKIAAGHPLSFSKAGKEWRNELAAAEGKHAGAEGPVADAFTARHIYVFGTQGAAGVEETRKRQDIAHQAAEWSSPELKILLTNRVAADKAIAAEKDMGGGNLVLFGTRETNAVLAKIADQLPLELSAGAADYGLVFIAPLNGRYVVVNSGLPWWTGAERTQRTGFRFLPVAFPVLQSFGDYILFKGSLENVIAEGRFDRNWKVPAADAAKMKETGAVTVR